MHVDLLFTFAKLGQYLGVKRLRWSSPVDHDTMGKHVSYKPPSSSKNTMSNNVCGEIK